jgi:hypothetical protein
MMRMLFIVLAISVLAIVGVGIGVFLRTRRKHTRSGAVADAEESQLPAKIPPTPEKSGLAKMKMNESDISA